MRAVLFLSLLLVAALPARAQVEVETPWSRATAPGAKVAAGYMVLRNRSAAPDRLVGATSPAARKVETHATERVGTILRMREVKGYDVPAGGRFELKPGGSHLMFVEIRQPFKEGDKVPAVLKFDKAGEVNVDFEVVPLAGPPKHPHPQHKH